VARPVLVLQHVSCEPAAEYADVLAGRGIPTRTVLLADGIRLPDWRDFDAIVAMGGPMGAGDDATVGWLAAEKKLIGDAVRAGVPYWGVCLGAQLLAAALTARVYTGERPEIGMSRIDLTPAAEADPVFGALPAQFPAFQWHGDTFDLPAGAVWLAGNDAYRHQAFAVGSAYALQFHLEAGVDLVRQWLDIPEYAAGLTAVHGPGSADRVLTELVTQAATTRALARQLFGSWLDTYVIRVADRRVDP
jgi:GMP synthase (glutamine-hydrolysing)